MECSKHKTIQLHPDDNVIVCMETVQAGESVWVAGQRFTMPYAIGIGHKLAGKDIAPGDTILKYGVAIGSATEPIRTGEHVHTHNMRSNYIETYLLHDD